MVQMFLTLQHERPIRDFDNCGLKHWNWLNGKIECYERTGSKKEAIERVEEVPRQVMWMKTAYKTSSYMPINTVPH